MQLFQSHWGDFDKLAGANLTSDDVQDLCGIPLILQVNRPHPASLIFYKCVHRLVRELREFQCGLECKPVEYMRIAHEAFPAGLSLACPHTRSFVSCMTHPESRRLNGTLWVQGCATMIFMTLMLNNVPGMWRAALVRI